MIGKKRRSGKRRRREERKEGRKESWGSVDGKHMAMRGGLMLQEQHKQNMSSRISRILTGK